MITLCPDPRLVTLSATLASGASVTFTIVEGGGSC